MEAVYLSSIRLVNCQSWKDTTIDLSQGLNVIRAENNTGKSVLFKILKVTASPSYYTNEEMQQLIRHKAGSADAYYLFSDKSCGIVRILANRVLYYYTDDINSGKFMQQEGVPFPQIISKLSLIIDQAENFIANIIDLDQQLLLVNSHARSNDNLIKLLTHNEALSRLKPLFEIKLSNYRKQRDSIADKVDRVENRLSKLKFTDVSLLEKSVDDCEVYLRVLKPLLKAYEHVDILSEVVKEYKNYDDLILMSELAITLEGVNEIDFTPKVINIDEGIIKLLEFATSLEEWNKNSECLNIDHSNLERLEEGLRLLDIFKNISLANDKAIYLSNQVTALTKDIENIKAMEIEIEKAEKQGGIVTCPIHGLVKYENGNCVPYSK